MENVNLKDVTKVGFKAAGNQQYPPYYQSQAPMPIGRDVYEPQQKKREKKNSGELWQKAGVCGTIGIAVALLLSVIPPLLKKKGGDKNVGNRVQDELEALTGIKLKFKDAKIDGQLKCADLESETTSPVLRDKFMNLVKLDRIIPESKKWSGTESNAANFLYLYGYGGTGKTYVAEQYAKKIGALFTSIKYPDLGSPFKDAASMKVNAFFDRLSLFAKENPDRKIVVCIDECDALIKKVVEGSHGAEEASKTRAAVLTGIDKLYGECENVTIVMTSNYNPASGLIDDVVKRRLNNCIEVPLPGKVQADAMTKLGLKEVEAIDDEFYKKSDYKAFIDTLVKEGYSNGEIGKICEEAKKLFAATLENVPKEDLTRQKHPFLVKYLLEGKKLKGEAASKTNTTMKVNRNAA